MKYSIVIPTRLRHNTFRWTLKNALAIQHDSYEVVVQNNGACKKTRSIVESSNNRRIVYRESKDVLPMTFNWERALQATRGEYVLFLGDDDGVLSDILKICDLITSKLKDIQVIKFNEHAYYWEDSAITHGRNRIEFILKKDFDVSINSSRDILKIFYDNQGSWAVLPMINSAFVHRDTIQSIINKHGTYFHGRIPDVYSGIANLFYNEKFAHVKVPYLVYGTSGHSGGIGQLQRSLVPDSTKKFNAENKGAFDDDVDESLIDSSHIHIVLANVKLIAKKHLFPDDSFFSVDIRNALESAIQHTVTVDPDDYDNTLAEIMAIARKNSIDLSSLLIPPKPTVKPPAKTIPRGVVFDSKGQALRIFIDCEIAGAKNIYDAARLIESISPSLGGIA